MNTAGEAAPALEARIDGLRMGGRSILQDLSLRLARGRWTAVVGPNGAGKSTLLRALAGLLPCRGVIRIDGRPLADWGAKARARQLAWLGQGEQGAGNLQAWDVVLLGRLPHQRWLAAPNAADRAAAARALQQTNAWPLRRRRMGELSGGERQRVLLARALAVGAPVLLQDEPLAHLDPPHQADWLGIMRGELARGVTVVSVLHEINMALLADELIIIQGGRLFFQGPASDVATHEALRAVFDHRIVIHAVRGRWVALPVLDQNMKEDQHGN